MAPTVPPSTLGVVALRKARKSTGPKGSNRKLLATSWGSVDLGGLLSRLGHGLAPVLSGLMLASPHLAALRLAVLFYISVPCISLS